MTQTNVIPTQKTDFTASFGTFNPFDTSLGTLVSVTATLTASATDSGTLTNNSAGTQSFNFSTNNQTFISGGPAPLVAAFGGSTPLSFASPTVFYSLAASASAPFPLTGSNGFSPGTLTSQNTFTSASQLLAFESGTFSVNLSTLTGQTFSGGGGNIAATLTTTEGGTLAITYTYNAPVVTPPSVPEPSTLAALGAGLVGLAFIRRRRGGANS